MYIIKPNYNVDFKSFTFPISAPVFIVQYLFDEAQITANNLIDQSQLMTHSGNDALFSKQQWEYLYRLGEHVKQTLENVS